MYLVALSANKHGTIHALHDPAIVVVLLFVRFGIQPTR